MSEQPFTAGPWRISAAIRGRHERVISAVGTPPLARTYYAKGGSSEANARLIAAAPALYAALKGAIGALEFSRDYHSDLGNEEQAFCQDKLDAALKAITQATGGENGR